MKDEPRRMAIIRISRDELRQLLKLPAEAEITGISEQVFFTDDDIAVRVEGVGPLVYPGNAIRSFQFGSAELVAPVAEADEPVTVEAEE